MKRARQTVLVTGGSGFLAGWIIIKLLRQGYRVRATLQDKITEPHVRETLRLAGAPEAALAETLFFQALLESHTGWPGAARGCDYVIHTASPFPRVQPKNADELIIPARDGTLRVLRASLDAKVKRVVMTSSASALEYTREPVATINEELWTDLARRDVNAYTRSKTLAELAAWDFVVKHPALSLTTIAPSTMLGPVLGQHYPFSVEAIKQLLDGSVPAIPKLGFGFVDVRDVAELHIAAMTHAGSGGERFLAGGPFLWLHEVADVLRQHFPEAKVPTHQLPNTAARMLALFIPSLRSVIHDLGKEHHYSTEKAERILGWSPRLLHETIVETAQSLYDHRIISMR